MPKTQHYNCYNSWGWGLIGPLDNCFKNVFTSLSRKYLVTLHQLKTRCRLQSLMLESETDNTDSTVASNRGQSLFLHPRKGHFEKVNLQEVILSIKRGTDDVVFFC